MMSENACELSVIVIATGPVRLVARAIESATRLTSPTTELGLVEHGLGKAPTGAAGAGADAGERGVEAAVVAADGDQPAPLRQVGQRGGFGIARRDRLLDEQVLARLERG